MGIGNGYWHCALALGISIGYWHWALAIPIGHCPSGNWADTKASRLQDLEKPFQLPNCPIMVNLCLENSICPISLCIVWMSLVFQLKSSIKLLPQTFQHQFVAFKLSKYSTISRTTLSCFITVFLCGFRGGVGQGQYTAFWG